MLTSDDEDAAARAAAEGAGKKKKKKKKGAAAKASQQVHLNQGGLKIPDPLEDSPGAARDYGAKSSEDEGGPLFKTTKGGAAGAASGSSSAAAAAGAGSSCRGRPSDPAAGADISGPSGAGSGSTSGPCVTPDSKKQGTAAAARSDAEKKTKQRLVRVPAEKVAAAMAAAASSKSSKASRNSSDPSSPGVAKVPDARELRENGFVKRHNRPAKNRPREKYRELLNSASLTRR